MKYLTLLLVPFCLFVITGCSSVYDFFIYNMTDQVVKVSYTLKEVSSNTFITDPEVYKIDEDNEKNDLEKLEKREVNYSSDTKTVTCKLKPYEALKMGSEVNFILEDFQDRKEVTHNVKKLTITKQETGETLNCPGEYVYLLLSKWKRHGIGIRIEEKIQAGL